MKLTIKVVVGIAAALLLVLIIGLVDISFVSISSLSFYRLSSLHGEVIPDVPVPSSSPVSLKAEGFLSPSTKKIEVSTKSNTGTPIDINVHFYKGACSNAPRKEKHLSPVPRDLKPFSDTRLAFNYNYGDWPVYVAGGNSSLTYHIAASNGPSTDHSGDCFMRLYLFNDQQKYFKFMESNFLPEEGYLNRSECIPVGVKNESINSTIVFPLPEPSAYFVSVAVKKDIESVTAISGHVVEYNVDGMEVVDCALNQHVNRCSISLDARNSFDSLSFMKSVATTCVWAKAVSFVSINVSTTVNREYKLVGSVFGGSVFILCSLIVILVVAVTCLAWCAHQRKHHCGTEKQPLLSPSAINETNNTCTHIQSKNEFFPSK